MQIFVNRASQYPIKCGILISCCTIRFTQTDECQRFDCHINKQDALKETEDHISLCQILIKFFCNGKLNYRDEDHSHSTDQIQ